MKRNDEGMAYLLQYENVAWYEDGKVEILDRRIYPDKIVKVVCETYEEVAQAITDMVTQSAGPYTAAGMGMALAANSCKSKSLKEQKEILRKASDVISSARPTTKSRMEIITKGCYETGIKALEQGESAVDAIFNRTIDSLNRRYHIMSIVGSNLVDMFEDGSTVMTQCFGETIVGTMCREAIKQNKDLKFYTPETRPYLQGGRLTASVISQMGFDTTVITDNQVAYVMRDRGVDYFTSAADVITKDGFVVNKIGTYQIATLAKVHNIPYYTTGIPDDLHSSEIEIEFRDPNGVKFFNDRRIVVEEAKALYPSFDITPPELVKGIVTDRGVFNPKELDKYYNLGDINFY